MASLLSIIGFLVPTASAQTLQAAGQGGSGVADMWGLICSVLPCAVNGTGGVGLVPYFAGRVTFFVTSLIGIVAVVMVIYAGIRMIASQGNEDGMTQGKTILKYTAVGLLLYVLSALIVNFVVLFLSQALS